MLAPRVSHGRPVSLCVANEGRCGQSLGWRPGTAPGCTGRAARAGTVRLARALLVIVALAATSLGAGLAAASPAAANGGVSGTISSGGFTAKYTVTGVTAGPDDQPAYRTGTVTGSTVTLSGTLTFADAPMCCFNMGAALYDNSHEADANWPNDATSDSPEIKTIEWPFSVELTIPPAPSPATEPYDEVQFLFRCFDLSTEPAGACGKPLVGGAFMVNPGFAVASAGTPAPEEPSVAPTPETPSPLPEETPVVENTPAPEETPTAMPGPTGKPCVDAGTRFSSLSGQVEVRHDWVDAAQKNWDLAKMNTVLCVDDHVKTAEDSTAIIGWADLSTFLLKPESEIVCSSPPSHDSKIGLVLGNIWVNVKKMVKDGTMEVDMSQAVAGIKGTTFVLGETGTASTLKVLEGTVAFTAKASGQTVAVSAGQTVQADKAGLSAVTSFDVTAESADWAKLGASAPTTASGAGAAAVSGGVPVALFAGLAVLLLACILLVARRRRRI